jgi:CrcB protein
MFPWLHIGAIAVGGVIGTLSRYGVMQLNIGLDKCYYTAIVNLTGCFIIGILYAVFAKFGGNKAFHDFLFIGCMGGYTTYSSFSLDAMQLAMQGRWHMALLYVMITVLGGICACALGLFGTTRILKYM